LTAGNSWSGKERKAMRCEHREICATPSGARKTKGKRWRFSLLLPNQAVAPAGLAGFSAPALSKSSHDGQHHAPVFSSPAQKILTIKPLPGEQIPL
jgi:hypothetical protein